MVGFYSHSLLSRLLGRHRKTLILQMMSCCCHIQHKSEDLTRNEERIGLTVDFTYQKKSLRTNCWTIEPIILNGSNSDQLTDLTYIYIRTKVTVDGDSERGQCRNQQSKRCKLLKGIWKNSSISLKTKVRIYKAKVLSVLLHGEESWKVPKSVCRKLEVLQNKCLERILH